MPNAAVRRQLCQEETEGYDANLTFDVNEYLIQSWPKLTFKNRQSIWTIFQEDIDFNDIENQIDDYIEEHFPNLEKAVEEDDDDDDDDEDESVYDDLYDAIWYYVQDGWDGFEDEEVLDELVVKMIEWLDTCVDEYWDDDEDDTDETVDTQSETNDENTSVN